MATRIKGITIEFNGDTTKLNKAFNDLNKQSRTVNSDLREINKALKFNPGNTELLAQKQRLLGEQIEIATKKVNSFKQADKEAQSQLKAGNISHSEYEKIKRELITAESQLGSFQNQLKKTNKQKLDALKKEVQSVGDSFKKTLANIKNVAIGAGALGTAAIAGANKIAETADEIDKMSQKVGFSTQAYQEWDYIASQNGTTMDTLQGGITDLAEKMQDAAEGTGEASEIFAALGVSVTDSNGDLRNQQDVFEDTITALQGMENASERQAYATKLMSSAGEELLPLINQQAGSIDEYKEKASELGLVMSDDLIEAGVNYTDTMDNVKKSLGNIGMEIGSQLLPLISNMANYILENGPQIKESINNVVNGFKDAVTWVQKNSTLLELLAIVIGGLTLAYKAYTIQQALLKSGMTLATVATTIQTTATTALGAAMAFVTSPITLVILAITALIAIGVLLYKNWDEVSAFAKKTWESVKNTFNNLKNDISNTFNGIYNKAKSTFNSVYEAVTSPVRNAVSVIKNLIQKIKDTFNFKWSLPKLKLPHVRISGGFSLVPPKTPSFSIDWYKDGGILTKPTVFGTNGSNLMAGGEAGPEAILPIEKLKVYIAEAMKAQNKDIIALLLQIVALMDKNSNRVVVLDDEKVGEFILKVIEGEISFNV